MTTTDTRTAINTAITAAFAVGTVVNVRETFFGFEVNTKNETGFTTETFDTAAAAVDHIENIPRESAMFNNTDIVANNPNVAGSLATPKELFGECGRFAVAAVHTRFDAVEWFVWDAETVDDLGLATVIRQEATREAAVAGLES